MIVTRRRKKSIPWKRYGYLFGFTAVIVLALWWAPSRTWLANGPVTKPLWTASAPVWKPIAKPFDAAAQQSTISTQSSQIQELQAQLADARSLIADRDKQISSLQSQLNQAQQTAADAHASRGPQGHVSANPAPAAIAAANDLSASATADVRRTAQVWSAMDSESAAKVVEKLPRDYVARVFALMSPDSVGAILENLPASYAAQLTEDHPELKH